jgi:hypothetical protein
VTDDARRFAGSRATRRNASLMLRCQPGPRSRKCAITSRSRRSDTSCFVDAFCGPRLRRYASTISGMTSTAGRARAHISGVALDASGSRAIPALISASSSSVISRAARNARRLASRHAFPDRPCIVSRFILISLAQTNDSNVFAPESENEQIDPISNETPCLLPQLAVVLAIIDGDYGQLPLESFDQSEIDLVFADVGDALCFVPFGGWIEFHILQRTVASKVSQANCSYNLRGDA